jgi:hypothetical protein
MLLERILAALGLGVALAAGLASGARAAAPDPVALYGDRIEFDILRNGDTIGRQTLTFKKENGGLTVGVLTDIQVDMLFVTVYRYRYEAVMHWHEGRLQDMAATTNDDGKVSHVAAKFDGHRTVVIGPGGRFEAPLPLFPGEHWDIDEIRQSALLNGVTGRLDPFIVAEQGVETIDTLAGKRAARRYVFSGAVQLTSWYDADGRWIGLRFKARDGSAIDYVCRLCGPVSKNSPAG